MPTFFYRLVKLDFLISCFSYTVSSHDKGLHSLYEGALINESLKQSKMVSNCHVTIVLRRGYIHTHTFLLHALAFPVLIQG